VPIGFGWSVHAGHVDDGDMDVSGTRDHDDFMACFRHVEPSDVAQQGKLSTKRR